MGLTLGTSTGFPGHNTPWGTNMLEILWMDYGMDMENSSLPAAQFMMGNGKTAKNTAGWVFHSWALKQGDDWIMLQLLLCSHRTLMSVCIKCCAGDAYAGHEWFSSNRTWHLRFCSYTDIVYQALILSRDNLLTITILICLYRGSLFSKMVECLKASLKMTTW